MGKISETGAFEPRLMDGESSESTKGEDAIGAGNESEIERLE